MEIRTSGSHRRYFVSDLAPKPTDEWIIDKLNLHRFRTIDQASNETESFGWVTLSSPSSTRFSPEDIWLDKTLCLGIRLDRKRLPSQALNVRLVERLDEERAESDEPISRNRRREIREELEADLLRRTIPTTSLLQVIWNVPNGELLFSSTSAPANRALISLYAKSFSRTPVAAVPHTMAERTALPDAHRRRLGKIGPACFVPSETSADGVS